MVNNPTYLPLPVCDSARKACRTLSEIRNPPAAILTAVWIGHGRKFEQRLTARRLAEHRPRLVQWVLSAKTTWNTKSNRRQASKSPLPPTLPDENSITCSNESRCDSKGAKLPGYSLSLQLRVPHFPHIPKHPANYFLCSFSSIFFLLPTALLTSPAP